MIGYTNKTGVHLLSIDTLELIRSVNVKRANGIAISQDGTRIANCQYRGIVINDSVSGDVIMDFESDRSTRYPIYRADGVVSSFYDDTIIHFDTNTGESKTLVLPDHVFMDVFNDGTRAVTSTIDGNVFIVDAYTGDTIVHFSSIDDTMETTISPNQDMIGVAGTDNTVTVLSVDGSVIGSVMVNKDNGCVQSIAINYAGDEIGVSTVGNVEVYRIKDVTLLRTIKPDTLTEKITFLPSGELMITSKFEGILTVSGETTRTVVSESPIQYATVMVPTVILL